MSWKRFLRRNRWDEERAREITAHLQIEADENLSRGMLPDEARYAANRKLGNATQIREEIYHMNSMAFLETVTQDLKFALRMLVKKPAFTIAAVLTLALGIGATTAIFSVVDSILIKPLPYAHSSELVAFTETSARIPQFSVSLPDFTDFQQQSHTFSQIVAGVKLGLGMTGVEKPEFLAGYYVMHDFLSTLGVHPMMGRDFLPQEDSAGTEPVVILSYRLWKSQMHGDPNVVGHTIQLEDHTYTIVGVLPQSFYFFDTSDLLAPMGLFPSQSFRTNRGNHGDTDIVGRLAPGATLAQARTEINGLAARLAQQYPQSNSGTSVVLTPVREVFVSDTGTAVLVLFGAVMFVLLIACANVANLFLVRGAERTKEIAVRLVFGAGRMRVVRQMLTESLSLAVVGGIVGALIGFWSLKGLERLIPPGALVGMGIEPHFDAALLTFVAAVILLVSIAFGLVPALHATRPDVQEALKDGGRSSTPSAKQHRVRGALAVAETALALVLVIGAGLMLKSLSRLLNVNSGIQPDHVLTMELNLPKTKYTKMPAISMFWQQLLERVNAVPGVESAAIGTIVPFTGDHRRTDISIEGQPTPTSGNFPHPDYHTVSAGYFTALGIPILEGRAFTDADTEAGAPVGIINATLAKLYWPKEDPVGKHFAFGHAGADTKWITIVGVAGDTKIYGLSNPTKIEVYIPYRQRPNASMTLVVRSSGDPASLSSEVQSAISSVDKDQAVTKIYTMNQLVELSVSTRHATLMMLGVFSGLALVLASIGIYGVMAYTVALRTHEIGIRMALGAQKKDVLRMIIGQGARIAFAGIVIGIIAALALTRLISSMLFSVSASDPVIFISVPALLVLVTLAACYIPAIRAVRVDPMVALRYE